MKTVDFCYLCDPDKLTVKGMTQIWKGQGGWLCKNCGREHKVEKRKPHQITCPFALQYIDGWFHCMSCDNKLKAKPGEIDAIAAGKLKPLICRGVLKVSS